MLLRAVEEVSRMINYIFAENLKHRRSFLKKLIVIAPLTAILNAFILMQNYFAVNAYNWWYVILMPASFALITAMIHRKDDRKLKYRAVFPLNISLKKMWLSKVFVALIYIVIASAIHMTGVFVLQYMAGSRLIPYYGFATLFLASFLLVVVNLWQIPFCLFLAKKIGFVASVVGNVIAGILLGIVFSTTNAWIFCPYSWGMRLMIPVLKILPNGTLAEAAEPMISNTSFAVPCIMSIVIFVVLAVFTANWFSKLEVK